MSDDQDRKWAELGQSLAQYRLELLGEELGLGFQQTAGKIARGEEITGRDIQKLYDKLEEARMFVDDFATVVPGSRVPELYEYMTNEEIQRVTERIKEDADA